MAVYPTTYFPAAVTAGAATPIAIEGGEERADITIAVRPVPAVRVSGRLVTPDGAAPPPTTIRLVGAAMTDVITTGLASGPDHVGLDTVTGMSDANGRFTLLGVPAWRIRPHARTTAFSSRAIQTGAARVLDLPTCHRRRPMIFPISSSRFDPRFASKAGSNTKAGAARLSRSSKTPR